MRRALLLLAAGCVLSPDQPPPFRVTEHYSGVLTAVDERTGFPLKGVKVEVIDRPGLLFWEGVTDGSGRVRFSIACDPSELPPEVLTVELTVRGYVRKKLLYDAEDFHLSATSDRGRSRKTVELRRGRGSETVDARDSTAE